jgi:hypothetical protein
MTGIETFESFFKENKKLVREYIDTKLDIYKLKLIRIFSRSAGDFIWSIISILLLFIFIIFLGLVAGFWLSDLTGSYVKGFGLVTLIILLKIILLAIFRRALFINPIIRRIVSRAYDEGEAGNKKRNSDH